MSCRPSRSILRGVLGGPGTPSCVQLTDGQPTEPPDECNLPVQFDSNTNTLWIYDCTNEQWLSTGELCNFRVASRNELGDETTFNLIGCLDGEPVQMPEFELCSVPSVTTAWFETNEPDTAYQIVCSPTTIGSDNGLIRVPYVTPFSVCELPTIDQASVDAGEDVTLAICINGEQRRAPYVTPVCSFDSIDQTAVDAASVVNVAACVDGSEQLIPYVPPYEYSICDLTGIDQTAVDNATTVGIAACVDGSEQLIPYYSPTSIQGAQQPTVNTVQVVGDTANAGQPTIDSRTSIPLMWSFTNDTGRTGNLTVNVTMWVHRLYDSGNPDSVLKPSQVLFMLGEDSAISSILLDGTQTEPYNNNLITSDVRRLSGDDTGNFWVGSGAIKVMGDVSTNLVYQQRVADSTSISMKTLIAIKPDTDHVGSEISPFKLGYSLSYTFES